MAEFIPIQKNQSASSLQSEQTTEKKAKFVPTEKERVSSMSSLQRAGRVGQSFTTGLTDIIGLPTDMVNFALDAVGLGEYKQIGGSDQLRSLGNILGLTFSPKDDPVTISERISKELGAISLPTSSFISLGSKVGTSATNLFSSAARTAARRPTATLAAETTAATSAALGGQAANTIFPDNEAAEVAGELLGGFTPSTLSNLPSVGKFIYRGGKAAIFPWTKTGGQFRAARRLQTASPDPETAASEIERLSETGVTPARMTGQEQLLEIENAVRRFDPSADWRISEQLTEAEKDLRQQARNFSGARPERVRDILENRRDYILDTLDVRAAQAGEEFTYKMAQLEGEATPRQISKIARETLETAYRDARDTEKSLWSAIDDNVIIDLSNSRQTLNDIVSSRSEAADPEDIPNYLPRLLQGSTSKPVNFAQDLRSRVLQDIRTERAKDAPNRRKISILSQVQDNILNDMRTGEGQSDALDTALSYSRELNEKFSRGRIGSVLGFERTGADKVVAEDTIDYILRGGTATTNIQELYNAAPQSRGQIEDFLKNTFSTSVIRENGKINSAAASRFFNKYGDILDMSPGVREELQSASKTGKRLDSLVERRNSFIKSLERPKKSTAALYLNAPIGQEIKRVLSSQNPAKTAAGLRALVRKDPEAVQGLKQAYVDELFTRSFQRSVDEEGFRFIKGGKFREMLNDTRSAAKALGLSDEELSRLETISTAFARSSASAETAKDIIGDQPSKIVDLIGGFLGAQVGGKLGSTSGSSLQGASRFSGAVRDALGFLTRDKATEIMREAVEDPKLFKDLLLTPTAPAAKQKAVASRLNTFLLGVAGDEPEENQAPSRISPTL